jgi:hypothetical protein
VHSCTSKFDHSRQRRITLPFTIRILNPKYLNDDDDEGERRSKHSHTGETPSAFFKQHQNIERERERRSMKTHTIYTKLYQTERRKKKWIFRQKSS